VEEFFCSPHKASIGEAARIDFVVQDQSGTGLKRIEVWLGTSVTEDKEPTNWALAQSQSVANSRIRGQVGFTAAGAGVIWVSIRAFDNGGNWNDEQNTQTAAIPGDFGPATIVVGNHDVENAPRQVYRYALTSGNCRDIWTTSVYSYVTPGEGPGGGLDDDSLRIGGDGDQYWSLIGFSTSKMPQRALRAALVLQPKESGSTSVTMNMRRPAEYWSWPKGDKLWWADRPASYAWTLSSQTLAIPTPSESYVIDITHLYNAWKEGVLPNYGILLTPTSTSGTMNMFYSSNSTEVSKLPYVEIEVDATDSDSDGIPDFYESSLGLVLSVLSASGDFDNDGRSDLREWIAGTDPTITDTESIEVGYGTDGASVRFFGSSGRLFMLEQSLDLVHWREALSEPVEGFGTNFKVIDRDAVNRQSSFYRVRISIKGE
jgi:hypothetical protein